LLCGAGASAQAGSYQVVDLGGTRNGVDSHAYGLNQHGAVAGQAGGRDAPHLVHPMKTLANGHRIDLAVQDGMAGVRGGAVAINDHGQTAGWIESSFGGPVVAFIEKQGTMTLLSSPSGEVPTVRGMNQQGDVVGSVWAIEDNCVGNCGFVIHDGLWTTLPPLPRAELSYALAINDHGLIVGESFQGSSAPIPIKAVQWRNGKASIPPGLEGLFAIASGVNDRGDIVGDYRMPVTQLQHAFLLRDGVLIDLDGRADSVSNAWGVNASGQAIGQRFLTPRSGFFVTIDGQMQWLDDLVLPGTDGPWTVVDVRAINDAGQIVGTAQNAKGQWRVVRLDPVAQ
jgi:uncharacterized membrane protein